MIPIVIYYCTSYHGGKLQEFNLNMNRSYGFTAAGSSHVASGDPVNPSAPKDNIFSTVITTPDVLDNAVETAGSPSIIV